MERLTDNQAQEIIIIIIIEFISNQKRGLQVKYSIVKGGGDTCVM